MSYASVLALIQAEIIANGNNEITANVLRPILEAMLGQPNDLVGVLDNLNTNDKTNIVNAINSVLSQNAPNRTALRPIDTTGIDFDQDELLWVRDAVNQTATNNGSFACNLGEQMVFYCDIIIGEYDEFSTSLLVQRRYYRLTTGATLVSSLGTGLNPPLMPDGNSNNEIDLSGDLVIDLGDIGTDDIEDAFNSDSSQPFTINGDKFIQAIQGGENKLWQWIGGDGTFGNSATLATSTNFVDLTGSTSPPLAFELNDNDDVDIDTPTDGQVLIYDDVDGKWKNETLPSGGTVTSVAVSGSDGIEVDSGSPITTSGTIALGIDKTTLLAHINVEDGADVTDATSVDSAGAVMETDYNANTILAANTDDTPAPITINEGEILGRPTGDNIKGMTPAETNTLLGTKLDVISLVISAPDTDIEVADTIIDFAAPYNFTLLNYWTNIKVAPTGAGAIVRVKKNGTYCDSVGTTINSGAYNSIANPPTITSSSFTKGDKIVPSITQIGSTIKGQYITLYLEILKT